MLLLLISLMLLLILRGFVLTEDECVVNGGHCFERTGMVYSTYPPKYPEYCKHCKKKRIAIPQEQWRYIYPEKEGKQ